MPPVDTWFCLGVGDGVCEMQMTPVRQTCSAQDEIGAGAPRKLRTAYQSRCRFFTGEQVQIIGGMAQLRVRFDGWLPIEEAPVSGDNGRHSCQRCVSNICFIHVQAERARANAQRIHQRRFTGSSSLQQVERRLGQRP